MIEGFRLKVTSTELQKHCLERADYHRDRAATKREELPKLREAMDRVKMATQGQPQSLARMTKGSYNHDPDDAVENLETDIRTHDNKVLLFGFFAGHLFDEDYNLTENDLQRLEILR